MSGHPLLMVKLLAPVADMEVVALLQPLVDDLVGQLQADPEVRRAADMDGYELEQYALGHVLQLFCMQGGVVEVGGNRHHMCLEPSLVVEQADDGREYTVCECCGCQL